MTSEPRLRGDFTQIQAIRRQRARGGPRAGGFGGFGGFEGPTPWDWAGPRGRGRGPRVRRGDVRVAILDVLADAEGDLNGYQVIQAIEDKTNGAWKPSPGSVYPTISQLEDEGLLEVSRDGGKKVLRLTAEGRTWAESNPEERAEVWTAFQDDGQHAEVTNLKQVLRQTMGAVAQVFSQGTPDQQRRAVEVLTETRRQLFGILADGPEA